MILREIEHGKSKPYAFSEHQEIVQRTCDDIGLPTCLYFYNLSSKGTEAMSPTPIEIAETFTDRFR
jgi:hypothetical protein